MKHLVYNRYPLGNKRFIWKQKDFILSTFACCPMKDSADGAPEEVADKCVRHLKEAGFNLLELGWVNHENAWAAVDACEKYGIDLLFQDMTIMGGMQHHCLDNKVSRDVVRDLVARLKPKKHTIGYYVWDEPHSEEQLAEARRQMDMLEEEDPEALLFTVTLPSYNNAGENKAGYSWENGEYAPYIERYIRAMDPPVLSFDYYPIGDYFKVWPGHRFTRENQLDDTFMWLDLALQRKLAEKYHLPLWFYYQGYSLYKCTDYFTFPMVRCFMYAGILYGAKGLQHYAAGGKNSLILKANGDKDVFFEEQKKIHAEIRALGDTLMALESTLVYHSDDLLPDCAYIRPLVNTPAESDILGGALPRRTSVGEFADAYGNRYMMILNRDYETELDARLSLKKTFRIYEVSRTDGTQSISHEAVNTLPVKLAPGDAVLLRVQDASEEPFTVSYRLTQADTEKN